MQSKSTNSHVPEWCGVNMATKFQISGELHFYQLSECGGELTPPPASKPSSFPSAVYPVLPTPAVYIGANSYATVVFV